MFQPYTYYLYHKPTGMKYYGCQHGKTAHPSNLWTTYFSSSKKVLALRKEYGDASFIVEIRKVFKTSDEARLWEDQVLKRLNVVNRIDWLNQSVGHAPFYWEGQHTEEHNLKIAKSHRGLKHTEESKQKMSIAKKNKPSWNAGKLMTEDHRRKNSEAKRKEKHPKWGTKWSDSWKETQRIRMKDWWKKRKEISL